MGTNRRASARRQRNWFGALSLMIVFAQPSVAAPVRFDFVAVIETINDVFCQCVPSDIAEGDTLTGYYYIDPDSPDTDPSVDNGLYVHTSTPYGIVVQHQDYIWETDTTSVNFRVAIANDASTPGGPEDRYTGTSLSNRPDGFTGLPLDLIRVRLRDATGSAIASDELPVAVDLEEWPSVRYLDVWGYQAEWTIRADIVSISTPPTAVRDGPSLATLHRVYPNPFNAEVTVEYSVGESVEIGLHVYDVRGRLITTLVESARADANRLYQVFWNGKDARGAVVSSGIYFCVLRAGPQAQSHRIVLVR